MQGMLPITGDTATTSSALIPVQAAMQAESHEQRLTVARQVNMASGGPVAMEITVQERRVVPHGAGLPTSTSIATPDSIISPIGTNFSDDARGTVLPYGPMRQHASREQNELANLRWELDSRLTTERAWEQHLQQPAESYVQNERPYQSCCR